MLTVELLREVHYVMARPAVDPMIRYQSKIDVRGPDDCWLWTDHLSNQGYGQLGIPPGRTVNAHRWGYEQLIGPIPNGLKVRHTCDVRACHNPNHWILGTTQDNANDMTSRNRQAKGERVGGARLTEADVLIIRAEQDQYTCQQMADRFGVTLSTVYSIVMGRTWRHVGGVHPLIKKHGSRWGSTW
jgi:hypothetical protein